MKESDAIALFRKGHPAGFWKKLHGNEFQANLPDVLWVCAGHVLFLEFKVVDGLTLPWSKCRLGQHLEMLKLADNGADVRYAVYSKKTKEFHFLYPSSVIEGKGGKL